MTPWWLESTLKGWEARRINSTQYWKYLSAKVSAALLTLDLSAFTEPDVAEHCKHEGVQIHYLKAIAPPICTHLPRLLEQFLLRFLASSSHSHKTARAEKHFTDVKRAQDWQDRHVLYTWNYCEGYALDDPPPILYTIPRQLGERVMPITLSKYQQRLPPDRNYEASLACA